MHEQGKKHFLRALLVVSEFTNHHFENIFNLLQLLFAEPLFSVGQVLENIFFDFENRGP
jgi:hypothetical protein